MTDTPKPTLAEELRALSGYVVQCGEMEECNTGAYVDREDVLSLAEQHESRWSAERAKLVAELEAFRALARLANHNVAAERVEGFDGYVAESIRSEKDAIVRELAKLAEEPKP